MDSEKIIEFLRDIAEQLGPAGQHAFQIVYQRVVGEAIIWGSVGSVLIILGLIFIIGATINAIKSYDAADGTIFSWGIGLILVIVGVMAAVPAFINLLSPEYATIERILNLVGTRR